MRKKSEYLCRSKTVYLCRILYIYAVLLFCGCGTSKYVGAPLPDVPRSHIEYVTKENNIVVKDSIFIRETPDTVMISEIHWRTKMQIDTVMKTDTIYEIIEVPVEKIVEKIVEKKEPLNKITLGFSLGCLGILLVLWFLKRGNMAQTIARGTIFKKS